MKFSWGDNLAFTIYFIRLFYEKLWVFEKRNVFWYEGISYIEAIFSWIEENLLVLVYYLQYSSSFCREFESFRVLANFFRSPSLSPNWDLFSSCFRTGKFLYPSRKRIPAVVTFSFNRSRFISSISVRFNLYLKLESTSIKHYLFWFIPIDHFSIKTGFGWVPFDSFIWVFKDFWDHPIDYDE